MLGARSLTTAVRRLGTSAARRGAMEPYFHAPQQWPGSMTPMNPANPTRVFLYGVAYVCSAFWTPFLIVRLQLKRANPGYKKPAAE